MTNRTHRRLAAHALAAALIAGPAIAWAADGGTTKPAKTTKAERIAAKAAGAEKPAKAAATGGTLDLHGAIDDARPAALTSIYASDFAAVGYGQFPPGWRDLVDRKPSRNWAVDGRNILRPMLKDYAGLLVFDSTVPADAAIEATFAKTPDAEVRFGLVARFKDPKNHYAVRFSGDSTLELFKVVDGKEELISSLMSMRRYAYGDRWQLRLATRGPLIAAVLQDDHGAEMARVDALDETFVTGAVGIAATTYAGAERVRIDAPAGATAKPAATPARPAALTPRVYPVLKPVADVASLNTPFDQLLDRYDVIVAGGGTGGSGAAIQASRMGASVLLLEETDWIGGQMSAAGVTAMDESGPAGMRIVRERGLYREFHEAMAAYYYTLDKDVFRNDRSYGDPNSNAGYEPNVSRAGLYAMIADARNNKGTLHVSVRSRVASVAKSGDAVTGATVEVAGDSPRRKAIASAVLIDATEYGDVIPLTGARYRVGNVTSDKIDPKAAVQDHTWTGVIREYPAGVPEKLRIAQPPPDYEANLKAFRKYKLWGGMSWGKDAKEAGVKEFNYRVYTGYRAVPDTLSPMYGIPGQHRNTLTSLNGGNDYPVTVATIEDPKQRLIDERAGIYKTLAVIAYYQNELGARWSVADEQGYDTPANRAKMKELGIRPDLVEVAARLPQMPYVRESRRVMGVKTLVASDLTRYENAKLMPTSLAMADYFMDLHGTEEAVEKDLDPGEVPKGGGPFQVPFEAFIPEKIDGFVPAEKNISQSRMVSGATRMQPSTMLMGQAAGTIAALSARQHKQPRALDPKQVQAALLDAGSTLVQRWYADVPWGSPMWRATQLCVLYGVMDRDGLLDKRNDDLGSTRNWGVSAPLTGKELAGAIAKLGAIAGGGVAQARTANAAGAISASDLKSTLAAARPAWGDLVRPAEIADPARVTAGEFAIVAARILAKD